MNKLVSQAYLNAPKTYSGKRKNDINDFSVKSVHICIRQAVSFLTM